MSGLEIERKFLIEYPDIRALEADPFCRSVSIMQAYIKKADGERFRIRRSTENGKSFYYETKKKDIGGFKRTETERELSEEEFYNIYNEAGQSKSEIKKTRYRMVFGDKYFEADVFPFWSDRALMETILAIMNDNMELFKQFQGNPSFRQWLSDFVFNATYRPEHKEST